MKILVTVIFTCISVTSFSFAQVEDVRKGEYLAAAAGCMSCHTAQGSDAVPYAGGHALKTPFGTFFTPNITPDMETGIGSWTSNDLIKAMKQGIRPDGAHYFPAFPYTSYVRLTDEDVKLIYAYLMSLKPVRNEVSEHMISPPFSWRWLQFGWKILFFDENGSAPPYSGNDEVVKRGDYLVNALGHCGECHTPRNMLGGLDRDALFAGMPYDSTAGEIPNLTPDMQTGIGDWSESDIVSFLKSGMKPNFDDVQGTMADVINHGTSKLTDEDLKAMAKYLKSLNPIHNKTSR
ncbi:cytochrome c [Sneathiella glossodoripedis]|uniref:cytochrome c n=1 Tax=Sneathiella glossodoripedis TaxID=418853 RepID=UPI00131F0449|nr:cytochrome c [Sneathiella glossodoripedis]